MEEKHPSLDIKNSYSDKLAGKKIVLCITGSVAAVKSSDLARLLMRHGADVFPVMSQAACKIIHPDLMHWATGRYPIMELTGSVEHVELAGNTKTKADLLIIAPCTANTIGKIAAGIDDTAVTTFATTAIGEKIPLLVVPAMHEPMYRHPFVIQNIDKLISCGITVMQPRIEEGKAKIAENTEIYEKVLEILLPAHSDSGECRRMLLEEEELREIISRANRTSPGGSWKKLLKGKKMIVTAGRTVEYLDPIRVITNNSSGKMGVALAEKAIEAGADVTLIAGKITVKPSEKIKVIYTNTAQEMYDAVHKELKSNSYDIVAAAAAVGDWQAEEKSLEKISTHENDSFVIRLKPTPKIIDSIKAKYPGVFLLVFRALNNMPEKDLLDDAKWRMEKANADMVAVNDVSKKGAGFESDTNEMIVLTQSGYKEKIPMDLKQNVAKKIIDILAKEINKK
ncbi:MAG: bifunctional phosphopantothenoylcysteine decarboxylase/phosphopantothenate--cysteine ligase CoaBC [Spirochaetes bacterium]|nr:bifunctional phosphopantothenoylcysteine decarboxylase/phosphopantothenate--cysteine ligase CoaBC [Spirochaetota bacterium]